MGEVAVDQVLRPGRAADGGILRIHAGDPGHQPVRLAQIKAGIHPQHHHRTGRTRGTDTRHHHEHSVFRIEVEVVERGKGKYRVEISPLFPELKLRCLITGVLTDLEHRDHHGLDGNRRQLVWCGSIRGNLGTAGRESGGHGER